jgi:MFS superfamily sulfate permease-like transporter
MATSSTRRKGAPFRGLEILRLNGPLFFANALRFRNEVRSLLSGSNPLKAILINLHANFGIDLLSKQNLSVGFFSLSDQSQQAHPWMKGAGNGPSGQVGMSAGFHPTLKCRHV